ncbi:MAG: hypothetical protein OXP66_07900 [Candidatus Tectomicrobia bacterium]|nr:hypothetical protein [Candidatus Tectomicrobia bacterium]
MAKATTLHDFMALLVGMGGTFILRNEHGSMELRGQDMYLHPYNQWLTVYHTHAERPEARSHLHLRRETLQTAKVCRSEGQTPYLVFSGATEPCGEPLLTWYFPSFYDWSQGKALLPDNVARFESFVETYGEQVRFDAEPQ